MFVDGEPICDWEWDLREAQVVCAMLNFPGAAAVTRRSELGQVRPPFGSVWVGCGGNETDIRDCSHDTDIPSFFHGGDAAGVVCLGGTGL